MYESYFDLHRRPFAATPDAHCVYLQGRNLDTARQLAQCLENQRGIVILTGPAGVGKTLLCRHLAREFRGRTIFLPTGSLPTRRALLQAILNELEQPYSGMADQELRIELESCLRRAAATHRGVLLIVDEAHLLSERNLEEIRLMADLAQDGLPLVQVILGGQFALEEKLTHPALAALNQRIAAHLVLDTLSRAETIDYIRFRLAWAGGDSDVIFTPDALDLIAQACDGLPRCINQLCDHSLLLTYVADRRIVSADVIQEALGDLRHLPLNWHPQVAEGRPFDAVPIAPRDGAEQEAGEEEAGDDVEDLLPPLRELSGGAAIEIGGSFVPEPREAESVVMLPLDPWLEPSASDEFDEPASEPLAHAQPAEYTVDMAGDMWITPPHPEAIRPPEPRSHRQPVEPTIPSKPSATRRTPPAEPAEERILDRYAALDAGRPLPPELLAAAAHVPAEPADEPVPPVESAAEESPEPPVPLAFQPWPGLGADVVRAERVESLPLPGVPDRLVESILPLIDEALGEEPYVVTPEQAGVPVSPLAAQHFQAETAAAAAVSHDDGLEAEIGAAVLDLCLDVQRVLRDRSDVVPLEDSGPRHAAESDFEPELELEGEPEPADSIDAPRVSRFDVVQPEPEEPRAQQLPPSRDIREPLLPPPTPSPATSAEQTAPDYKQVFSLLRRRQRRGA